MAITENTKEVKVVLKLTKGSQTIRNCNQDATAEQLYTLGNAVADLHEESIETVTKVTETLLA